MQGPWAAAARILRYRKRQRALLSCGSQVTATWRDAFPGEPAHRTAGAERTFPPASPSLGEELPSRVALENPVLSPGLMPALPC